MPSWEGAYHKRSPLSKKALSHFTKAAIRCLAFPFLYLVRVVKAVLPCRVVA